ncbi:hypothetical protein DSL72_000790 [Monilinia vaccinii-corymbosi]|uniref:Uncharacterized protein n=1 Tax=Monilinia vaccinii-corymbosi TaxID=61207 RepID=A0A8A3PAF1_9HELO|nr:hypothetical protein DSL72_000790 [Monilinia vaccinii-corymbosi]
MYYDNLYEEFRKSQLVPRNHLVHGPNIEFICNITEADGEEVSMRLLQQFPTYVHLGSVATLNVFKEQNGERQKSSFEISAENSVLGKADPFAWGLPIPIPVGAIGGATAGSMIQSPPEGSPDGENEGAGADTTGDEGGSWLDDDIPGRCVAAMMAHYEARHDKFPVPSTASCLQTISKFDVYLPGSWILARCMFPGKLAARMLHALVKWPSKEDGTAWKETASRPVGLHDLAPIYTLMDQERRPFMGFLPRPQKLQLGHYEGICASGLRLQLRSGCARSVAKENFVAS